MTINLDNKGCIINGVDEKMILFSQCHFFLQKKIETLKFSC